MTDRVCKTCGGPLPTMHANRKFCSERCRKAQYDIVCTVCGGRVDGTTPSKTPDEPVCESCSHAHYAVWTKEAIVRALQLWAQEHGHVPSAPQFQCARVANPERIPTTTHVIGRFGTWNAAITAAGLTPNAGGPRRGQYHRLTRDQHGECVRRYAAGESSVSIAADVGCSPQWVIEIVRRAGVAIRPAAPFGRRAAA